MDITATGHSRNKERKVANWLYISIGVALLVFAAVFLTLPRKISNTPAAVEAQQQMNPTAMPQTPADPASSGSGLPDAQPTQQK